MLKVSPITAVALPPVALIPGLKIDPSELMKGLHGVALVQLGEIAVDEHFDALSRKPCQGFQRRRVR